MISRRCHHEIQNEDTEYLVAERSFTGSRFGGCGRSHLWGRRGDESPESAAAASWVCRAVACAGAAWSCRPGACAAVGWVSKPGARARSAGVHESGWCAADVAGRVYESGRCTQAARVYQSGNRTGSTRIRRLRAHAGAARTGSGADADRDCVGVTYSRAYGDCDSAGRGVELGSGTKCGALRSQDVGLH